MLQGREWQMLVSSWFRNYFTELTNTRCNWAKLPASLPRAAGFVEKILGINIFTFNTILSDLKHGLGFEI